MLCCFAGFTFPKGRKKEFLDQVLDYTIQDINSAHAAFRYEASISHVEEGNLLDTSQACKCWRFHVPKNVRSNELQEVLVPEGTLNESFV